MVISTIYVHHLSRVKQVVSNRVSASVALQLLVIHLRCECYTVLGPVFATLFASRQGCSLTYPLRFIMGFGLGSCGHELRNSSVCRRVGSAWNARWRLLAITSCEFMYSRSGSFLTKLVTHTVYQLFLASTSYLRSLRP